MKTFIEFINEDIDISKQKNKQVTLALEIMEILKSMTPKRLRSLYWIINYEAA